MFGVVILVRFWVVLCEDRFGWDLECDINLCVCIENFLVFIVMVKEIFVFCGIFDMYDVVCKM